MTMREDSLHDGIPLINIYVHVEQEGNIQRKPKENFEMKNEEKKRQVLQSSVRFPFR